MWIGHREESGVTCRSLLYNLHLPLPAVSRIRQLRSTYGTWIDRGIKNKTNRARFHPPSCYIPALKRNLLRASSFPYMANVKKNSIPFYCRSSIEIVRDWLKNWARLLLIFLPINAWYGKRQWITFQWINSSHRKSLTVWKFNKRYWCSILAQ